MKARKLLAKNILQLCWLRHTVGVPITKLHRDFNIDMSIPLFTSLIEYYQESTDIEQTTTITNAVYNSLFPEWLKDDCKVVQSQPKLWRYKGKFPLGSWLRVINENN